MIKDKMPLFSMLQQFVNKYAYIASCQSFDIFLLFQEQTDWSTLWATFLRQGFMKDIWSAGILEVWT